MKEIKGEFRSFVIPREDQCLNAPPAEIENGANKVIQDFSRNIGFIKEISAVNEKVSLNFKGVPDNGSEIPQYGSGPFEASFGVGVRDF